MVDKLLWWSHVGHRNFIKMCDDVNRNPFAGLFSTINDALSFSSQSLDIGSQNNLNCDAALPEQNFKEKSNDQNYENLNLEAGSQDELVDKLVADVFGLRLSLDAKVSEQLVYLDSSSIERAVFERLMLRDPESKLVPKNGKKGVAIDSHVVETQVIPYLFECHCRLQRYKTNTKLVQTVDDISRIILRNVGTTLQEPDLFPGQKVHGQLVELLIEDDLRNQKLYTFIAGVLTELDAENNEAEQDVIDAAFRPVLDIIHKEAAQSNLMIQKYWFNSLRMFSSFESLAKLMINHSTPKNDSGRSYSNTLFGALLSLSCLPKSARAPFYFFRKPLREPRAAVEGNIWSALDAISESLHKVFHSLLKCSDEVRHLTLQWIGNCLHANASRGKLSNFHDGSGISGSAVNSVSDGFMLNLGSVLLRLCQPFCGRPNDTKVLMIDPTYCAAEAKDENESRIRGLHMKGLTSQTCLIPTPEGETRPVAESYKFVTECFYLTHRALDLGYRVVLEKFVKSTQDLGRLQRVYHEAQVDESQTVLEIFSQRVEMEITKYLSFRASLLAPDMLNLLAKFHAATACWLLQVNLNDFNEQETDQSSYVPKELKPVTFPLPDTVPKTLRCIPEFVVENTVGFLYFLRIMNPNVFEEHGPDFLNPILTEIITLMESPKRLYNPHLRARLAEGLEALLPLSEEGGNQIAPTLGTFHRQQLFLTHPHRHQIVSNLLQVFVSIEMTGQSVQFEQKFNYRRPMYIVMNYLWKIPEHRNLFKELAEEAEANMEAVEPPLYLRFINLLMNDAVFLLDEALSNMAQLKQLLHARESGEWNNLQRNEQTSHLQYIAMIARFNNILGRETINTLKVHTTEIKSIFCHPTMVDRIASMLNYLLLQLVGPNNKNLKVKDQKEYDFNPANLVLNICEIYINLSYSDTFTLAVSQDGRSYRPELFKLAENVLVRIGGVGILGDLDQFAKKVEQAANQKREEDEILNGAPEEFLDPIMSTLMTDPVILPSTKITVDRQTIARHLLSDQTDPFNRSPLTMDMVKSNIDLRNKIQEWVTQKKQERMPNCSTAETNEDGD
ncbi:ubiquitin conjugation factor E4 A isoform X2 [Orussus abietinus]|uniref:ubiquitin conjugation factor E4 A isoform X2 n=1 Tax=Orussus abietinus TaxID=222816 RepID=UPI000625E387|nr:ubiquitin conjugation factor E4 A isoform X2 [Orussus abietinus]XP_012272750.1 ubiquitin conjugation factor E4 A isoform X2 [Orussus abietinus]XP_012272751.1 ubiquitin conjugation factor E4 A isoform X2 [Orussus abietinus]